MASAEPEVIAALTSVNAPYVEAAKQDILNALSEFCDLYPAKDSYVFNDGSCRQVVTLTGTVPINYKGNTYNIPLCLYLLDTYPYNAPICYVRPTQDMMIKTSHHVDSSGKVFLPYLREWRHPKSDLLGLLQVLDRFRRTMSSFFLNIRLRPFRLRLLEMLMRRILELQVPCHHQIRRQSLRIHTVLISRYPRAFLDLCNLTALTCRQLVLLRHQRHMRHIQQALQAIQRVHTQLLLVLLFLHLSNRRVVDRI